MTPVDGVLVAAGRAYSALSGAGRSTTRARLTMVALVLLSVLTLVGISLITTPSETTFDDLQAGRYRGLGWLRLSGDLRDAGRDDSGRYVYTLHDPTDESIAVTVYAPTPLPTGFTDVTGQARTDEALPGTFDTFHADAITEPARHDPWLLIALPALIALFLAAGARVGYPVVRRQDRSATGRTGQGALAPGDTLAARWSGRLGGEERGLDDARDCTVAVAGEADVASVTVVHEQGSRTLVVRRSSPKALGRICRVRGCTPHLEIHAPSADVILEFASAADRDRLAAALT
jgi:hypothetical protein